MRSLLLALVLAMPVLASAQTPPLLAVLEFDASEDVLGDSELELLTDAMRGAVKKEVGGRYKVMTRETMMEIVPPEQLKCFAGKCVAEIGRMLQAPYVIAANVKKLSAKKVLTVEAYESKGGQLLGSEQMRGTTAEELLDLLDKQARGLVRGWLNLNTGAVAVKPAVSETKLGGGSNDFDFGGGEDVVTSFESDPAGAIVLLDGQMLCAQTPCSKPVSAGSHQVLMTMEGYDSAAQQVDASPRNKRVSLKLPPNFALLTVVTTPAGLPITLDGKAIGTSPITDRRIDAKAHDVMVQDPCYADVGERIVVGKAERRTVKLDAQPRWAGLKVSAEDEAGNALEAEIEVDGQPMGTTPKNVKVPMCAKEIVVKAAGGKTFKQALSLRDKEVVTIAAKPAQGNERRAAKDAAVDGKRTDAAGPLSKYALYKAAQERLDGGDVKGARLLFRELVENWGADPLAANSQYWIGESYYRERLWREAVYEFHKVMDNFPESDKVPDALLKIGFAFEHVGLTDDARVFLDEVQRRYPKSSAARLAREKPSPP
jgi:tol-pal system protein YbgF